MNSYLPILTLVGGALLGLLSSLMIAFLTHRRTISLRLLDQYLEVRKDVVDTVSDLTALDLHQPVDPQQRLDYRKTISKVFYRHFDFLPEPVLDALLLLEVCLGSPERGPYAIASGSIRPMQGDELASFIERSSRLQNARFAAAVALKSNDATMRANEAIQLHARHRSIKEALEENLTLSSSLTLEA
jgi:hypothetical protein